ncbi:MAG TPA: carbon monoxide dehydrogenase [Gammaproteobacteria bacterium]|nr:carbon monoxide dehydrogenase [Gammaproteobacteria bacterium]|tara:strand:+ start:4702 stop:7008 length:2307 start_codon:yes stop_codon:yes gene_type:complete
MTLPLENYGAGKSQKRGEDNDLVRGRGVYTDDVAFSGEAFGVVVRSPHPAASIRGVDLSRAVGIDGLNGIVTGSELKKEGIGPIPFMSTVEAPGGGKPRCQALPILAIDEVRYVGQPVAFVVAKNRNLARDIAENIEVEYVEREHVIDLRRAVDDIVHVDGVTGNVVAEYRLGDPAQCDAGMMRASHRVSLNVTNNRVIPNPLEPRVAIGLYDNAAEQWTLFCGNQGPHLTRDILANDVFGVDPDRIRICVKRIGGGFGSKITPSIEDVLVLYAARKFSVPVRWRADRSESFLSDYHARDHRAQVTLGFDENFRITAMRVEDLGNLGAYPSPFGIPIATSTGNRIVNGVYDIPVVDLTVKMVLTHTVPTGPYRGAGRPEVVHRLECALEQASVDFGIDAAELRRRNFIRRTSIPYTTPSGLIYDSGNFPLLLEQALKVSDWDGFAVRKVASYARGLIRGRGLACHIDSTSGIIPSEIVEVVVDANGRCEFRSGTQEMGQGLHHTYVTIAAAALGLSQESINVVQGDTSLVKSGVGSYGSRSLYVGGAALAMAAEALIEHVRGLGAELLEVTENEGEVRYEKGIVMTADGSRQVSLSEIAASRNSRVINVEAKAEAPFCFPNGCYVCEVDIDSATGRVSIDRFTAVDDVGRVFNPMIVHGQVHGGLAQGIGQALLEHAQYDIDSGQLITGSLLDYALPRASDVPSFEALLDQSEPAVTNLLGVKGAGESGAVGGPPAVVAAIADALPGCSIKDLEMPVTAEKLWGLLAT